MTSRQRELYLQDRCEECGFEPEHQAQLQLHHRNGGKSIGKDGSNLGTLCANCHVLHHATGPAELVRVIVVTTPVDEYRPLICPRCKTRDTGLMVRGTLTNDSQGLPPARRGTKPAKRVSVHCNRCGYTWRSVSPAVVVLKEDPDATRQNRNKR